MTPPTPILDALAKHPTNDQPNLLRCYRPNMESIRNPEQYDAKNLRRIERLRGLVIHQSPHQGDIAFLILWNDGNTTVWLRKHLTPATLDHTTP